MENKQWMQYLENRYDVVTMFSELVSFIEDRTH